MISKSVCTSSKEAVKYFEDHLSVADYYVKDEKMELGEFVGKVAKRVGLENKPVTRDKFIAFTECDMKALGAKTTRPRKSEIKYIEFTYSAPKAVSIVAALDDRVKGELYAAVKEEMRWFEKQVTVRDRRGKLANEEVTRPTGEMIAALFRHETSRSNDPDFHVHALIGNVTWDKERKGYFAVHYGQMLELRKTLDARVHNNLAGRLKDLGYGIEPAAAGFGLKEVPRAAIDLFSERTHQVRTVKDLLQQGYAPRQITEALKGVSDDERRKLLGTPGALKEKLGKAEGKASLKAGHQIDQIAVKLTRPDKIRITSKTLREDVARRLKDAGLVVANPSPARVQETVDLTEAFRRGTEIAFDKQSVVRLDHLLGEIVRLAPGQIGNEKLAEHLRDDSHFLIRRKDDQEHVTTREILSEEQTLLTAVARGMGACKPLMEKYVAPATLVSTPERIGELVNQARLRGEQLTPAQAEQWLDQFAAIHRYVTTSKNRFLNVRGGAGTGKTFCLEQLVGESQKAGHPVFVCAPYGEQARVTLRSEAPRIETSGHPQVAAVFAEANTVDALLIRARRDPLLLRGADIYVDEAGLLDTPKARALAHEAERADARIIFQGDTEQMAAVGRGQPIRLLQEELGFGMSIPRASISRRQLSADDKELAADLSSGNEEKFAGAVQKMIDREMIRETPPEEAVELVAKEIVEARASGKDIVAVSSVHRISDILSNRIHALHVEKNGSNGQTSLDVHVKRELQPAELRSTQFYRIGDVVEYKKGEVTTRAPVTGIATDALSVDRDGMTLQVPLTQVRAVFDLTRIERGTGERLLLQEKIKQGSRVFEKNSRQTISHVQGKTVHFTSGLTLAVGDGRIRQGDSLTDYKAQGIKGTEVRGIEDIGSSMVMANKEAFHVKGTRHVESLILHVENKGLYVEAIQRSNVKITALGLERLPKTVPYRKKGDLFVRARKWGKEFISRKGAKKRTKEDRQTNSRFNSLKERVQRFMREKMGKSNVADEPWLTPEDRKHPRKTSNAKGAGLTSRPTVTPPKASEGPDPSMHGAGMNR